MRSRHYLVEQRRRHEIAHQIILQMSPVRDKRTTAKIMATTLQAVDYLERSAIYKIYAALRTLS